MQNAGATQLKLWLIVLTLCSGCASDIPKPEPIDAFSTIEIAEPISFDPLDVPTKPNAVVVTSEGVEYLAYTVPEAETLEQYLLVLTTNAEAAADAKEIILALEGERVGLVEAGRLIEQRSNYLAEKNYSLKLDLENERREHMIDNWIHRAIFIIGIAIGL